jgi:hypothetical protein
VEEPVSAVGPNDRGSRASLRHDDWDSAPFHNLDGFSSSTRVAHYPAIHHTKVYMRFSESDKLAACRRHGEANKWSLVHRKSRDIVAIRVAIELSVDL